MEVVTAELEGGLADITGDTGQVVVTHRRED